ncbi:hypothetical protein HWV07_06660 [Natronomonas salina]|uniref:hypothetical protein n=1 Tax=Natronomonas salina TaxID=1710540 RepID=UPI0015B6983A|nr:hypothetical protein [Natronomonas salina]QLD88734.1 hypothetical protein HWV07_06660 [Natronomonas salina]
MKRRRFLAGAGAVTTGLGGYVGARLANVRRYAPRETVDDSLPPGERIYEAARLLHVLDHRAVSRVTVLDDGTNADPYRHARYRRDQQRSRHRYLEVYTTYAMPPGMPPAVFPHTTAQSHHARAKNVGPSDPPLTSVWYFSAGTLIRDPIAETPSSPDDHVELTDEHGRTSRYVPNDGDWIGPSTRSEYVLSPDVNWTLAQETDETVTYEIAGREAYAKVPPILVRPTEDCSITATIDRETGRLLELDDHRAVEPPPEALQFEDRSNDDAERRYEYRIVTEFDRYGTATAREPKGVPRPSTRGRLEELWANLRTY